MEANDGRTGAMTEQADRETGGLDLVDPTPGRRLRDLVGEATGRGAPMVSSHAMQSRLFSVYDDVASQPEALALVQRHLGLTLDRTWYSAREVESLASILDGMLDGGDVPEPGAPLDASAVAGGSLEGASGDVDAPFDAEETRTEG
jgi:hypothetical protein